MRHASRCATFTPGPRRRSSRRSRCGATHAATVYRHGRASCMCTQGRTAALPRRRPARIRAAALCACMCAAGKVDLLTGAAPLDEPPPSVHMYCTCTPVHAHANVHVYNYVLRGRRSCRTIRRRRRVESADSRRRVAVRACVRAWAGLVACVRVAACVLPAPRRTHAHTRPRYAPRTRTRPRARARTHTPGSFRGRRWAKSTSSTSMY